MSGLLGLQQTAAPGCRRRTPRVSKPRTARFDRMRSTMFGSSSTSRARVCCVSGITVPCPPGVLVSSAPPCVAGLAPPVAVRSGAVPVARAWPGPAGAPVRRPARGGSGGQACRRGARVPWPAYGQVPRAALRPWTARRASAGWRARHEAPPPAARSRTGAQPGCAARSAAVRLDDALRRSTARPRPGAGRVPAPLRLERRRRQFRRQAGAVVDDADHDLAGARPGSAVTLTRGPGRVVPDRVVEQVDEHLLQPVVVGPDGGSAGWLP